MKHGWFEIDGVQTGEHRLEGRLQGLHTLAKFVPGASILDLGCAEGLIGAWLHAHGGRLLDGVDANRDLLATARKLYSDDPTIRFFYVDLNREHFSFVPTPLLPSYDIVLCLCLAHKFREPREFLTKAAQLCNKYFALHLPAPLIDDARSNHVVVDPDKDVFEPLGFECILHVADAILSRKIYRKRKNSSIPLDSVSSASPA